MSKLKELTPHQERRMRSLFRLSGTDIAVFSEVRKHYLGMKNAQWGANIYCKGAMGYMLESSTISASLKKLIDVGLLERISKRGSFKYWYSPYNLEALIDPDYQRYFYDVDKPLELVHNKDCYTLY